MRTPKIGDIWLVHYPYITPGNMEKIRPAIIKNINEEKDLITIQKLSTKYHKGSKIIQHPKLKKKTYISKEIITTNDYNLIRYIGTTINRKRVIK